jgi:PAS domain S-box-containing protein
MLKFFSRGDPVRQLTLRYGMVLGLLAVVSAVAFVTFQIMVKGQDVFSTSINVSGRQRYLSQQVALNAMMLARADNQEARKAQAAKLRSITLRFQNNRVELERYRKTLEIGVRNNFDNDRFDILIEQYAEAALALADIGDKVDIRDSQYLHLILTRSEEILRLADGLVSAIEGESLKRTGRLQIFAVVGEALTLVLLLFSSVAVFSPLVKRVRKTMAGLAEMEGQNRAVLDSMIDGILLVDPETRNVVRLNPAAERLLNLPVAAAAEVTLSQLLPSSADLDIAALTKWHNFQAEAKRLGGLIFPVETTIRRIVVSDKDFLTVIIHDITNTKRMDAQIRKLSQAVEQSSAGVIITDTGGNIEYANPKMQSLTGYDVEELLGRNSRIFKSGRMEKEHYVDIWQTLLDGKEWHGEVQNRRKDGSIYWESQSISPLRNADGKITNFMAVKEDISAQKAAAEALAQARMAAESANRAKSEFLAGMSHELRTPLNAILGFSDLMVNESFGELNQRYLEYAYNIHNSGERLLKLINDILDLSRVTDGTFALSDELVEIPELIDDTVRLVNSRAAKKHLVINSLADHHLPQLHADSQRVKQVLVNLLDNAIKFTPENGIIDVSARITEDGELVVKISDTGIGIRAEDIPRIVEPFAESDPNAAPRADGPGLGLPLSKCIMELHNGWLAITSVVGEGTTVSIGFPAKRVGV